MKMEMLISQIVAIVMELVYIRKMDIVLIYSKLKNIVEKLERLKKINQIALI
jgi:hypothetical protein